MKKLFIVAVIALLSFSGAYAQNFSVTVTDTFVKPLPQTTVVVGPLTQAGANQTAITNENGVATFANGGNCNFNGKTLTAIYDGNKIYQMTGTISQCNSMTFPTSVNPSLVGCIECWATGWGQTGLVTLQNHDGVSLSGTAVTYSFGSCQGTTTSGNFSVPKVSKLPATIILTIGGASQELVTPVCDPKLPLSINFLTN